VNSVVLDASALLALVYAEPGSDVVGAMLSNARISAVNLSEVAAKLAEGGMTAPDIRAALDGLGLSVVPFDADLAYAAGLLRPATKAAGLSLGDRACLALAARLGLPALTADAAWQRVDVGVDVRPIRS